MKVGDLVKYKETTEWVQWGEWIGIIIREIGGMNRIKVVHWLNNGERGSFSDHELEAV